ncbi:MAG: DUF3179 domain-containing protein [Phycisphaerae bacterium]|nr:DUF3179 domain-containing protein [Phycisphaerae bacterium]
MTQSKTAYPCTDIAAARLAPFEPGISSNFEMPIHIGKLIACWDRPQFVTPKDATHMRTDDYVVGVEHAGQFRAYPLWITDNYHMINDRMGGDPVLFSTCERCQSGSAFVSKIDGKPVKFSAMGMYNASLTMVNRKSGKGDQHSLWLHYEGVAIDGPQSGQFLEQIPTYHMTWDEWLALHPDTDVMLPPDDPHHRDARHGHGREEYFSRPGMDPPLAKTITGHLDYQYPENEMVLGLNLDAGICAFPLMEIKREGHVLNADLGDIPIVVMAGPRPEQVTMSAFSREVGERVLTFVMTDQQFRDEETGSVWTIEGKAVAGKLAGQQLQPLRWQYVRWHAWVYPHPETELFVSSKPLPRYPDFPKTPQVEAVDRILTGIASLNPDLRFSHVILNLCLPHEARHGISVFSGEDRLNLYEFHSPEAAKDYVDLQTAWFCFPFDTKIGRKRALCLGSYVLESDPTHQFAEPTQTVHLPDNETPWSKIIEKNGHLQIWSEVLSLKKSPKGHFMGLLNYLRSKRYDVVECAYLPHSQQRVGTISAIAATIEADRFAIYRCDNEGAAARVAQEVTHAIAVGDWVFRSIPVLMYADPHYEMGQLPDDTITWSPLLKNKAFRMALDEYAGH